MHHPPAFNALNDVSWLADLRSQRLLYASIGVEGLFGFDREALLSNPERWNAAVMPADAHKLPSPFFADVFTAFFTDPFADSSADATLISNPSHAAGESVREYTIIDSQQRLRHVRDRRFCLRDAQGRAVQVAGITEEIVQGLAANLLADALPTPMANDASHERVAPDDAPSSGLLAQLSRELQSPLNAIRAWSHVLRRTDALSLLQTQALDAIERNAEAQVQTLQNLLHGQHPQPNRTTLEPTAIALVPWIEQLVDTVRPAAQSQGIMLRTSHTADIEQVTLDCASLSQAMRSLLMNTVRRCAPGTRMDITTRYSAPALEISLRHEMVASNNPASQADLQGELSLAMARRLIERQGGHLLTQACTADDADGLEHHGSHITHRVLMPLQAQATPAEPDLPGVVNGDACWSGASVMVVDDDDDSRQSLTLMLQAVHAKTRDFPSAASACAYLANATADEWPDALISDISMPGQDGYDFIREVRKLETLAHRPAVRAIALTALSEPEDRCRATSAGFNGHVAKPITTASATDTLAQALGLMARHGAASARQSALQP